MLKPILDMLNDIAKLLGIILVAIPLVILGLWLAKSWFYDAIPKTRIPVASEAFMRRLPGIIIWDSYMILNFPDDCKEYGCKVFIPSQNETLFLTPEIAKMYQKKYLQFCKANSSYPKSPNQQFFLTLSSAIYNTKTQKKTPLIIENRFIADIDWSPDNHYALYRVEYNNDYPADSQNYLYIVRDLKTHETYRILKDPEANMDTCWVNK